MQAVEKHLLCNPMDSGNGHGYFLAAPFCGVIGKQPCAWSVPALKVMTLHGASAARGHFDRGGFGCEVFICSCRVSAWWLKSQTYLQDRSGFAGRLFRQAKATATVAPWAAGCTYIKQF
jgi:hypothetical protein